MTITTITAAALKAAFKDGAEIALFDAREEVPFDARHLLMACCVPLGQLELLVDALVPKRTTRVVWCDAGEGFALSAATKMRNLGYTDVQCLDGGIQAWANADLPIYSGIHVPSKAFAEVVEHVTATPWIGAAELHQLIENHADMVLLDSRTFEEYHGNSIPGAINVPGAELVYRFKDLVPSEQTLVVVNCGGRTRSIIGAQALINAGFANRIVSLRNGTQDWHLGGFEVIDGADRRPPAVSTTGLEAALAGAKRIAEHYKIASISTTQLTQLRGDTEGPNLFVLDVRTLEEFTRSHLAGTRSAPGGQLVQETDSYLGVWGGRVVLVDDNGVRATVTASWLKQMGWSDVSVHCFDPNATGPQSGLESGPWQPRVMTTAPASDRAGSIDVAALVALAQEVTVIDLSSSKQYKQGHIDGAWFALRTTLADALTQVPAAKTLCFTSADGELGALASADVAQLEAQLFERVVYLDGGNAAWRAAGEAMVSEPALMASSADDIRLKAREMGIDIEAAMRAYLAWEIELVNQMETDTEQRFDISAPA